MALLLFVSEIDEKLPIGLIHSIPFEDPCRLGLGGLMGLTRRNGK